MKLTFQNLSELCNFVDVDWFVDFSPGIKLFAIFNVSRFSTEFCTTKKKSYMLRSMSFHNSLVLLSRAKILIGPSKLVTRNKLF